MIRDSKEIQIGKAGEYLVCADLIIKGFVAFPSEQGLPYDVLLDTGKKLLKIQVKTTLKPRKVLQRAKDSLAYIFSIKRAGKKGITRYEEDEIDLFALVCLDTMKIGYIKNKDMPVTINIRPDELKGTYYDEDGLETFNKVKILQKEGLKCGKIAIKLNKHQSTISRYMKENHVPFVTEARYFSDIIRLKEWFYDI